jgi:hypothetical protein
LLDRKAWRPAWQEVIVLLGGLLADPAQLLRLLSDGRRDDVYRHRLAVAALCLTEVAAGALETAVAGKIAREVIALRMEHDRKGILAPIPHLERALVAVGRAGLRRLSASDWVSEPSRLSRDPDRFVREAAAQPGPG